MNQQLPMTHAADPSSSHRAEAEHKASGAHAREIDTALYLVRKYPGRTAAELGRLLDNGECSACNAKMLRRRLGELFRAYKLSRSGGGGRELTYRLTYAGRKATT